VLAGMCDEGLEAITLLWSGEPVSFRGRYVTVDEVVMRPVPVQQPRVPVFIGGTWPRQGPARRAARWDGSVLNSEIIIDKGICMGSASATLSR